MDIKYSSWAHMSEELGPTQQVVLVRAYRTFRKWSKLEEMCHLVTGTECCIRALADLAEDMGSIPAPT